MDWCPICRRQDGTHWTVPHVWTPRVEQERILRWFGEKEAIAWLKRRLREIEEQGVSSDDDDLLPDWLADGLQRLALEQMWALTLSEAEEWLRRRLAEIEEQQ